jgi:thymidylate synthase
MIYRKMSALAERMASEPFDGLTLPLPRLIFRRQVKEITDFRFEDIEIAGYQSHPHIAAPVAV